MTNDDKRLEEIEERKKLLLQGHAVECSYTLVPQHYICNCGYSDAFEAFPLDAAYLTNRVRDAEKEIGVQKAIAETRREQRDEVAVERDRLLGALRSAAVRLEILTSQMRACREETGSHNLIEDAERFAEEAQAALKGESNDT